MRFIPSSCLKPGMITARNLYGYSNELMLGQGQVITEIEINRIRLLQFQGIYIADNISSDIEVSNVISSKLRNNTVKAIKDIFVQISNDSSSHNDTRVSALKSMIDHITDEVLINKNAIINMIDLKSFNDYTYYHSVNVAVISLVLGVSLGLGNSDLYRLGLGALLHDIGKVFIPMEILDKPGKLTPEEFEVIKEHSAKGSSYLKERWEIPIDSNVAILNHHEKYDGTGYPFKLKADKISHFGRIIAVADVYDALTSDRPYGVAFSPSEAMEYVMGGGGSLFDPKIVASFASRVLPYPVGTCVELSNHAKAIVVENFVDCGMRPKVRLIRENEEEGEPVFYDLYHDMKLLNITITGIAQM